jgi:hypothetical protein
VIDHVIVSNEMKDFYISETAEILTSVASAVSPDDFGVTTSDHYPVLTRYTWQTSTSVKDQIANNNKLSVYPNPTTGVITLNLNDQIADNQNFEVSLMTLDGRIVFKTFNSLLNANLLLNEKLKNLDNGIYLLNIIGKKGTYSSKVFKK